MKCQNCGMENAQGIIFCRNCGQKLDLDMMESSMRENIEAKPGRAKMTMRVIKRFIFFCILAFIGYLVYGVIDPFGAKVRKIELSTDDASTAMGVYTNLRNNIKDVYTLPIDQVNYIANKYFLPQNKENDPVLIATTEDGKLSFSIARTIYQYIPFKLKLTVVGNPVVLGVPPDDIILSLNVTSVKIGCIPIPAVLRKYVFPEFVPYYNTRKLKNICSSIYNLEVQKDKLVIHFNHE